MLSSVVLGLVLAVGAHARPLAGRYAQKIESRAVSNGTYDFILAGGGIAGLTVADRLSEIANGIPASNTHTIFNLLTEIVSLSSGHRIWPLRPTR